MDDLTYEETQRDLLLYLLPLCLRAWSMNVLGETAWFRSYGERSWRPWGSTNEYRSEALFDQLSEREQRAFQRYVIDCIVDAIDRSPGLQAMDPGPVLLGEAPQNAAYYCCRWIRQLGCLATICPGLCEVWNEWWNLETKGRAIAALQYISCLMYEDSGIPVFASGVTAGGGSSPIVGGRGRRPESRVASGEYSFSEKCTYSR